MRRRLGTSLYAGLLFTALGVIAWASGQPFVFPSLGPTAFVLAFEGHSDRPDAARIVASHLIGGLAGLLAWSLLGGQVPITATPPPLSAAGLGLAASATLSIMLTSWAMIATDAVHPPACATTLIVSLGLLSTPRQVGIIVVAVAILVGVNAAGERVIKRVDFVDDPLPT
ncbi:HPP family protein [Halonotius roseus]|uniref:HPP family protein n=1 Tax=Halonotius roseus TaxID=2511997 RepID=A0A544QLJ8_9EURY|nr:HPP family protein [Halonotius roseus]TQQ79471.1 HPP family protein [Halonotius roseus]